MTNIHLRLQPENFLQNYYLTVKLTQNQIH